MCFASGSLERHLERREPRHCAQTTVTILLLFFQVLFLDHPKKKIRDTQKYKPFKSQVKVLTMSGALYVTVVLLVCVMVLVLVWGCLKF